MFKPNNKNEIVNEEYNQILIEFKKELRNKFNIYYPIEIDNRYLDYIKFIKLNKNNNKLEELIKNKIKHDLKDNKKFVKVQEKKITLYF
jgi:hypothetical protein